jgi:exodeoxyribonuclease V alpha subunit
LTVLQGTVERVVFRGEGGFTVARLGVAGSSRPVTVAGRLSDVVEGESVRLEGEWVEDPRYGRQLRVDTCAKGLPPDAQAAERFLGSGLVPGVRSRTAAKIVEALGADALKVIVESPEKLALVKGLGKKKRAAIVSGVQRVLKTRAQESFLRALGLGPGLTERILRRYGEDARRVVEEAPYQLARELDGVGFLTADRIARTKGVPRDDAGRLRAGLSHALQDAADSRGDTALPVAELLDRAAKLLGMDERAKLESALDAARTEGEIAIDLVDAGDQAYLPGLLAAERGAAAGLAALAKSAKRPPPERGREGAGATNLTEEQSAAVTAALSRSLSVITGGPGVGKTTVVKTLVASLESRGETVLLAAPTGRAAKRLEEATGHEAKTLHRLLEWNPRDGGFTRDARNPLEPATVVVDEASMVDVRLCHSLVRALPRDASLVLVGDRDQLPSVGAGNVLGDVIESGAAEVARLTRVFRQARASRIVENAHRVRVGDMPDLEPPRPGELEDFFFVEKDDPEAARDAILRLVAERIPRKFGLDPKRDVQVLSPMRKGHCGSQSLNEALRKRLNPAAPDDIKVFVAGDKVMQVKNDYDRDVFNGDVGEVASVEKGEVRVRFDAREVVYDRSAANALVAAYCVTIHKSQGGEFPAVVVPVLLEHWVLLARNLLYTAMTRGRKLVVLVGQRRALERAVATTTSGGQGVAMERRSHLATRLHEAVFGPAKGGP